MPVSGVVAQLHRYPVKSMAGEPVEALRIDGRGAAGDRTHALLDPRDPAGTRRVTAREAPRLLAWRATYDGADPAPENPPVATVVAPDGTAYGWDDAGLAEAIGTDVGRAVVPHRDVRGQQDLHDTLLVTTQATLDALAAELDAELDLRRFRTNVHLVLDAPAFAEERWENATLTVGNAILDLLHPCVRCVMPTRHPDTQEKWPGLMRHLAREHDMIFGINARPRGAATIRVGDVVRVSPSDG